MHRPGSIVFSHQPNLAIPFQTALFDSGALSANYISPSFLEKHRQHLQPLIEPFTSSVRLGDARTVLDITSVVESLILMSKPSLMLVHCYENH